MSAFVKGKYPEVCDAFFCKGEISYGVRWDFCKGKNSRCAMGFWPIPSETEIPSQAAVPVTYKVQYVAPRQGRPSGPSGHTHTLMASRDGRAMSPFF